MHNIIIEQCSEFTITKTTHQGKVFPNAGSMAKSKGKVDKGTWSADLVHCI